MATRILITFFCIIFHASVFVYDYLFSSYNNLFGYTYLMIHMYFIVISILLIGITISVISTIQIGIYSIFYIFFIFISIFSITFGLFDFIIENRTVLLFYPIIIIFLIYESIRYYQYINLHNKNNSVYKNINIGIAIYLYIIIFSYVLVHLIVSIFMSNYGLN